MAGLPLRWQAALLYSFGIGCALVALQFVAAPRLQGVAAFVTVLLAAAAGITWMLQSRRVIHLRRERRIWMLVTCSSLGACLALECRIYAAVALPVSAIPWGDFAAFISYGFLWFALLAFSGKSPHGRFGRLIPFWDVLIITWSAVAIIATITMQQNAVWLRMPTLMQAGTLVHTGMVLASCYFVTLMLSRTAPRALHVSRGLFVIGVLLVLLGTAGPLFYDISVSREVSLLLAVLGSLGFLCYGIAALYEAGFYDQRSPHSRLLDPFPTSFGLLLPGVLLIMVVIGTLQRALTGALDPREMYLTLAYLCILLVMMLIRELLSAAHHRRLYQDAQQQYTEMAQHAATDPLTNLANHRYFTERMQKEMRRAMRYRRPLALIFCDLDHFKRINDTYGHNAGDRALRAVAESLQREVREIDIVARYGGEEFVIILPETTRERAEALAERLRVAVQQLAIPLRHTTIALTISCGVSAFPDTCDSADSMLASADRAMYQAKTEGRNRIVCAPQLITDAAPLAER